MSNRSTQKWNRVSSDWQQFVHEEQEDGVAKDESHFEGRSVHALWGEDEAEEVQGDEETAGGRLRVIWGQKSNQKGVTPV